MTRYRSLDLNDTNVICKLVALDTDMSQFHYLCLEQGPLFKLIFDEFVTDAHRKGLQQKQPGMPGCPPHVSHIARVYWKPQIEKSQITAIQTLFTKFQVQWHELFSKFNAKFYFPRAEPSLPTPWTALNTQLMTLATSICAICSKLGNSKDMFLAASDDIPQYTVIDRTRPRRPLDALLLSLAQLSSSGCGAALSTAATTPAGACPAAARPHSRTTRGTRSRHAPPPVATETA